MKVQRDVEEIAITCRRVEDGQMVPSEVRTCVLCGVEIYLSLLMKLLMSAHLDSGVAKTICTECGDKVPEKWPADSERN